MANLKLFIKARQSKQMMKPITLLLEQLKKMQSDQSLSQLEKKKWLNEKQAAIYLSIGNHNMFKDWRDNHSLPFHIPNGKKIIYKRIDLDALVERTRCEMPIRKQ